jgi:hypothetical protein
MTNIITESFSDYRNIANMLFDRSVSYQLLMVYNKYIITIDESDLVLLTEILLVYDVKISYNKNTFW